MAEGEPDLLHKYAAIAAGYHQRLPGLEASVKRIEEGVSEAKRASLESFAMSEDARSLAQQNQATLEAIKDCLENGTTSHQEIDKKAERALKRIKKLSDVVERRLGEKLEDSQVHDMRPFVGQVQGLSAFGAPLAQPQTPIGGFSPPVMGPMGWPTPPLVPQETTSKELKGRASFGIKIPSWGGLVRFFIFLAGVVLMAILHYLHLLPGGH